MISELVKQAMKDKNKIALNAYRSVKARMLNEQTKKGGKDLDENELFLNCIQAEVKERKEANSFIKDDSHQTKVDNLEIISILDQHLPQKITGDELKAIVEEKIKSSGASSAKEMGKVMALLNEFKHQMDMKEASSLVKSLLN